MNINDTLKNDSNHSCQSGPSKVKIVLVDGSYQVTVNGSPYIVKGAGIGSCESYLFSELAKAGGNTFRTWSDEGADEFFKYAEQNNLMVVMGIDLDKELHGFDYNDSQAVEKQFEKTKSIIQKYKNHPNLLAWAVANEPNLLFDENGELKAVNPKVYDAISDIIDYIHKEDPNHPVTYTFAGVLKEHLDVALAKTPQVDFVSLQVYGDLKIIPQLVTDAQIDKPFMITEFGPLGHWERPMTSWGREIEEPSGMKAESLCKRLEKGLKGNPTGKDIGHFVFLWGQKQERTPTWYGMFTKDGFADARVDQMTQFWTGRFPDKRAPNITNLTINRLSAESSVTLSPNQKNTAQVTITDPDISLLKIRWELKAEVNQLSQGGEFELEPDTIDFSFKTETEDSISFQSPNTPGEYRLFVYSYDDNGKVGYANFPFLVAEAS